MTISFSLNDIEKAAADFWHVVGSAKLFAFHGDMGAGKTTFIHALCNALKVSDNVSSPTFSIINEYKSMKGESVYHMDLYRIKTEREAIDAGVEDALFSDSYCFVEWPERAPGILPESTVHCFLSSTGMNTRKLRINL
jgi:tRNA threonylcarbamoyladenosine biosynthesis protein TsaE